MYEQELQLAAIAKAQEDERFARFHDASPAMADRYRQWQRKQQELFHHVQCGAIETDPHRAYVHAVRVGEMVQEVFQEGILVRKAFQHFMERDAPSFVVIER